MLERSNIYLVLKMFLCFFFVGGAAKFYHYNYVEHTEHARNLKLPGLVELVCKGEVRKVGAIDQCGNRGIYRDADWGVTAYFTIYGIESKEEAEVIAKFMVMARKQSKQEHIPMNLAVYSVPRSAGSSEPSKYKIFDRNL